MNFINALALLLHIVGLIFWLGSIGVISFVVLPLSKSKKMLDKYGSYESILDLMQFKIIKIAKHSSLLVLLSGIYLMFSFGLWTKLLDLQKWYILAMIIDWILFSVLLFYIEPLFFKKLIKSHKDTNSSLERENIQRFFSKMNKYHLLLLVFSFIIIGGNILAHL